MLERFTPTARAAVVAATEEARGLGSAEVGAVHLLLALATDPDSAVSEAGVDAASVRDELRRRSGQARLAEDDAEALRAIGIDLGEVVGRIEEQFGQGALAAPPPSGRRPRWTREAKKVLELSLREAVWLKAREISTDHLALGLIRAEDDVVVSLLRGQGMRTEQLRAAVLTRLGRAA